MLAALDALCELDLLSGREQRDLADVLQEELQRVGGDLRLGLDIELGLVGRAGGDDRDLRFLEPDVEVVELARIELELIERERELVGVELPRPVADLEQALPLVSREDVLDRRASRRALRLFCGQNAPHSSSAVTR